ncbi:hypothetical protein FAM23877_00280 [Propionibacterium freudenreichii]|uniref:hypothetical protein n=1 Tax=Propionibacterium freudenreichii TaxID=1744 RepID=UPI0012D77FB9|nr:hypothetical protein [Propionibacterium freudenreichii]MDK9640200.1 hypothetical protein [Propionibacterium freudenreichii]WGU90444.1 hypothetical protein FAM23877_00280 [Propionibacterium freudenreichii]
MMSPRRHEDSPDVVDPVTQLVVFGPIAPDAPGAGRAAQPDRATPSSPATPSSSATTSPSVPSSPQERWSPLATQLTAPHLARRHRAVTAYLAAASADADPGTNPNATTLDEAGWAMASLSVFGWIIGPVLAAERDGRRPIGPWAGLLLCTTNDVGPLRVAAPADKLQEAGLPTAPAETLREVPLSPAPADKLQEAGLPASPAETLREGRLHATPPPVGASHPPAAPDPSATVDATASTLAALAAHLTAALIDAGVPPRQVHSGLASVTHSLFARDATSRPLLEPVWDIVTQRAPQGSASGPGTPVRATPDRTTPWDADFRRPSCCRLRDLTGDDGACPDCPRHY